MGSWSAVWWRHQIQLHAPQGYFIFHKKNLITRCSRLTPLSPHLAGNPRGLWFSSCKSNQPEHQRPKVQSRSVQPLRSSRSSQESCNQRALPALYFWQVNISSFLYFNGQSIFWKVFPYLGCPQCLHGSFVPRAYNYIINEDGQPMFVGTHTSILFYNRSMSSWVW